MISPQINPLVRATASPAILETRAWLELYDGHKGPKIDLSQAAPPYPPPQELLNCLSKTAALPEVARYGPVLGEFELRAAYARHTSKLYGATIAPEGISITGGCNQAFLIAAMLVAQRGEAIILPVPWYFNHKMTLDMLGIQVRELPCLVGENFAPSPAAVTQLIDANVRALVLVTPNNPTGAIYSPENIQAFGSICRDNGIWLILDETYRDFLPEKHPKPHALFENEFRKSIIGLYSFSKSLALPGYRLGAMIYPPALTDQVIKVQDCVQICAARVGQIGAAWALTELEHWRRTRRKLFAEKANAFGLVMKGMQGWEVDSIGAYFAYVRHPFEGMTSVEVARRLASENGLLLIPGSHFGPRQEKHLRVSFGGLSPEMLDDLPYRLSIS